MDINPLPFESASIEIKKDYQEIINSLNIPSLPIFFQYFGRFPDYLHYIVKPIANNLKNKKFLLLTEELLNQFEKLIIENFELNQDIKNFISRYLFTPQFYHFKNNLNKIVEINLKMTVVFLALRESIKGWAIAAKKIPSNVVVNEKESEKENNERFVFNETKELIFSHFSQFNKIKNMEEKNKLQKQKQLPEINFLVEFFKLCQIEFNQIMKTEKYLLFRVMVEKLLLNSLSLLPETIISPINIVLPLISKQKDYPDFLYLLSESFPQLSVQKLIFSDYLNLYW